MSASNQVPSPDFYDLLAEAARRYRDVAAQSQAITADRDRLRGVVEGLIVALGKYVDEVEVARWRALAAGKRMP